MRVKCIANSARELGPPRTGPWYGPDYEWWMIETGQQYEVFGFCLWRDGIGLFLSDERGLPDWFPAGLFEIVDGTIPGHWRVAFFPAIKAAHDHGEPWPPTPSAAQARYARQVGVQLVVGYPELAGQDYLLALQDRDQDALLIFEREKARVSDD